MISSGKEACDRLAKIYFKLSGDVVNKNILADCHNVLWQTSYPWEVIHIKKRVSDFIKLDTLRTRGTDVSFNLNTYKLIWKTLFED